MNKKHPWAALGLLMFVVLAHAGDRMNNGGGSQEWLLSHLRTDLSGTMDRCLASSACSQELSAWAPLASLRTELVQFMDRLDFRFEGLPESGPCVSHELLTPQGVGGLELHVCVPSLYEVSGTELTSRFSAYVLQSLAHRPAPEHLVALWSNQASRSLVSGEAQAETQPSAIAELRWYAVRAQEGFSELLIFSPAGSAESLTSPLAKSDLCDSAAVHPDGFNFTDWNIQEFAGDRWVVTVEFTAACASKRWAGEALWELSATTPQELSTHQLSLRNLRPLSGEARESKAF